jgi:glyoxylase-like metal-dependent hydrolase (beta-lactamase superfamily II)
MLFVRPHQTSSIIPFVGEEARMRTKVLTLAAVVALAVCTPAVIAQRGAGNAQAPANAPLTADAQRLKAIVDAAADALGLLRGVQEADSLSTLELWGTGTQYAFGQAYKPEMAWPAFKVSAWHAGIGYDVPGMRIDLTRTNPDGPVQGGGGLPLAAPQRQIQVVNGNIAWNEQTPGMNGTPALAAANDRALQIWITPAGVVKAARAAGLSTKITVQGGNTILTFPVNGTPVTATMNAKNLVETVTWKIDNPVLGDVLGEVTYSDYKDLGGELYQSDVLVPQHIVQKLGGLPVLDITLDKANAYNPYVVFPVPDNVQKAADAAPATPPPPMVNTQKLADGVFYLAGGTHFSVAVEFKDHIGLIEAPLNEARSLAVIAAAKAAIPNKPIKYLVNTHHHFDHSGGLRTIVAEGIPIITQAPNKAYYEKVWASPHTISPDRLARSPKKPNIELVLEKRVLSDGTRTLELYKLAGSNHADTMLIAYLPKETILVEADVFTPGPMGQRPPVTAEATNLYDNLQRLKLDVNQIASIHGRMTDLNELRAAAGRTATN